MQASVKFRQLVEMGPQAAFQPISSNFAATKAADHVSDYLILRCLLRKFLFSPSIAWIVSYFTYAKLSTHLLLCLDGQFDMCPNLCFERILEPRINFQGASLAHF